MAPKPSKADKKIAYDSKLCSLIDEYGQVLIVVADNVGSKQLQNIRKELRRNSVILMGKNTMMKRSVRIHAEKTSNNAYLNLVPLLVGNVGLIFTKGDLKEVNEEVGKYKNNSLSRIYRNNPIRNDFGYCCFGLNHGFRSHSRQNNKENGEDLSQYSTERIRNFSIIAHIDHSKVYSYRHAFRAYQDYQERPWPVSVPRQIAGKLVQIKDALYTADDLLDELNDPSPASSLQGGSKSFSEKAKVE